MYLTEEEAKMKWCPMIRAGYGCNRESENDREGFHCISSGCMMWRWSDPATKFEVDVPAYETKGDPIGHDIPFPSRRGYCGLGGRP